MRDRLRGRRALSERRANRRKNLLEQALAADAE